MECPRCGSANRLEAKFCDECAAPLRPPTPAVEVVATAAPAATADGPVVSAAEPGRLTNGVGAPALTAPPPVVAASFGQVAGARRLVTVLFADVCGFTARMERQEPEWVHRDLNRLYALCDPILQRHGGTLHKRQADGVMVLFGVPTAREDDSWRAVTAAWEMLRAVEQLNARLRAPMALSIGVETGWVVFDQLGSALMSEDTVLGEAANLAARLQAAAGSGQIYVGEGAKRATARLVDYRPLKPLRLKNVAGLVQAYVVEELHPERLRSSERAHAMLAGRDRELGVLGRHAQRLAQGLGGVVCLRGEPGIGKSRLKDELRAMAPEARWVEAAGETAPDETQAAPPCELVTTLLRQVLRVTPTESDTALAARLRERFAGDGDLVAWIESLAGLPNPAVAHYDESAQRDGLRRAVACVLARAAAEQALVVAIDDLQWADSVSQELLDWLLHNRPQGPILFCVVVRPGFTAAWLEAPEVELLAVERLDDRHARRLLYKLAGTIDLPGDLVELVVEQAGGNPHFLAELLDWLRDEGVLVEEQGGLVARRSIAGLEVPGSIQMIVQARIDRLDSEARELLQIAAVVGAEFDEQLLRAVYEGELEAPLEALLAEELLARLEVGSEPGYRFKHVVSRDLAYRGLLLDRRQRLHQRVAEAMEEVYAAQLAERYEILAWHWQQAEEWDRAAECYRLAGERAWQTGSEQAAETNYELELDSRRRWRQAESHLAAARAVGRAVMLSVVLVLLYLTTRELLPAFWSYLWGGGLELARPRRGDPQSVWREVWHADVRAATTYLFTVLSCLAAAAVVLLRRPQLVVVHPGRLRLRRGRTERDVPFSSIMAVRPRGGLEPLVRPHPDSGRPVAAMPALEVVTSEGPLLIGPDEVAPFLAALWKEHREGQIDALALLDPELAARMAAVGSTYVLRRDGLELVGPYELGWLLEQVAVGQVDPRDEVVVRRPPPWDERQELPAAPAATVADIGHPAVAAVCQPIVAALDRVGAGLGGTWVRPLVAAGLLVALGLSLLLVTAPAQLADAYAAALPGLGIWLLASWLMTQRQPGRGERRAPRALPPLLLAGLTRFEAIMRRLGRLVLGLDEDHQPPWRARTQAVLTAVALALGGAVVSYRLLVEWHYPPAPLLVAVVVGGWSALGAALAGHRYPSWLRVVGALSWTALTAGLATLLPRLGPGGEMALLPLVLLGALAPLSCCGGLLAGRLIRRRPTWGADLGPALLTALLAAWLTRGLVATAALPAGPEVVNAAVPWGAALLLLAGLLRRTRGTRLAGLASLVAFTTFVAGAPVLQHTERAMLARWFEGVDSQPWLLGVLLLVSSPWLWGAGCLLRAVSEVATARGMLRCAGIERARSRPGRRWRRSWLAPRSRWESRCGRRWRSLRLALLTAVPITAIVLAGRAGPAVAESATLHARPLRQAAALAAARQGGAARAAALLLADPPVEGAVTAAEPALTPKGLLDPQRDSEAGRLPEYLGLLRLNAELAATRSGWETMAALAHELNRRRRPGTQPGFAALCGHVEARHLRATGRLREALRARELVVAELRTDPVAAELPQSTVVLAQEELARARLDLGDLGGAAAALRPIAALPAAEGALREAREILAGHRPGQFSSRVWMDPSTRQRLARHPGVALSHLLRPCEHVMARDLPLAAIELRLGDAAGAARGERLLRFATELRALALPYHRADRRGLAKLAGSSTAEALAAAWILAEWVCYLQGDLLHADGAWRPVGVEFNHVLLPVSEVALLPLGARASDWLRGAWLVGDKSDFEARLDLLNLARLAPHDAELRFASAEGYRKEGDPEAARREYGRYLAEARIPTTATAQPRLQKLLRRWGAAPGEAAYERVVKGGAARVRRHVMEATQARRRVAARWPLTLGLAALVAGAAPAQMPSSAVGNEPGATPVTTGWTYSDIFWQTYISVPSGYSVTPDYAVGETSIPVQVYGPSTTTVDFLWDYAWYFFDEYWNYLGEEYDQRLVPVASYQLMVHGAKRKAPARTAIRNAKAINLVGGGDQGGRIMPDRGATLSKHWRRTSRGQAVDDSYESLLGVDLSQDAEVFYFPRPDISVISRRMVAQDASPLQFRRVFREKASGNSVGMPAGWFHSWDVRATQTNNGDVVLQLPALDPDQWAAGDLGKPRPAAQSLGYELHARGGNKATGYRRLIVNWRDPLGAGTQWELVPERGRPLEFRLQSVERPSGETRWFTWGGSPLRLLAISDSAGAALELEYQGDALKTVRSSMGPWDNDGSKQAKATYELKQDKWTIVSTSRPSPNSKEKERWVIDLNRAGGQVLDIQDGFGSVKHDGLTVTRTASQLPVIKDRQGKVVREYQGQPGNIKPKP